MVAANTHEPGPVDPASFFPVRVDRLARAAVLNAEHRLVSPATRPSVGPARGTIFEASVGPHSRGEPLRAECKEHWSNVSERLSSLLARPPLRPPESRNFGAPGRFHESEALPTRLGL